MFTYDAKNSRLVGTHGALALPLGDQASLKMAMLLQGECTNVSPRKAAKNFGFSKSRYYQVHEAFTRDGVTALINQKTGPKHNYRRTSEATKLVIRSRFLDPDASSEVIASKLTQHGNPIATRSVERIITDYGLQKKTPSPIPRRATPIHRHPTNQRNPAP